MCSKSVAEIRVGFKYVFIFEYRNLVYSYLNLKGLVVDIWSVFEKYLQIQLNTYKNYQQKESTAWHKLALESKTEGLSHLIRSGQAALRKLVYSEAGQTLASMNEWEASEAYL